MLASLPGPCFSVKPFTLISETWNPDRVCGERNEGVSLSGVSAVLCWASVHQATNAVEQSSDAEKKQPVLGVSSVGRRLLLTCVCPQCGCGMAPVQSLCWALGNENKCDTKMNITIKRLSTLLRLMVKEMQM